MSETTQVTIPGGCLQNTKISLKCKAPDEKIEYTFSLSNQLSSDEEIVSVQAQPPYGSSLTVDSYTYNVNIFTCRISGGRMLYDEPIRFVISTQKNTIYSFVCVLPIRQQGTLIENCCGMNGVLDPATPMGTLAVGTITTLEPGSKATVENIGTDSAAVLNFGIPKGDEGQAATVTVGKVTKGDAGSDPIVTNSGTLNAAILDFTFPAGEKGETPTIQIGKTTTLPAGYDATVEATTDNNVVTLYFGIPSGTTGEAGQYILNIGTVTTLSPGQDATAEITSDSKGNHSLNLGIPQGTTGAKGQDGVSPTLSIGTVDTLAPDEKATADIIHGSDGKDTINFAIPQGAPGANGKDGTNGTNGQDGTSYVNNGSTDLDVKSTTTQSIAYSDIIAVPVELSFTVPAANQNGFYTPLEQSAYKGQFITQIGFSVQTEGTMTVYIIDNFDTSNTITVASKVLNLKKDQVWYDFNMYLPTHMYLSVCNAGTDTGVFYFNNKATDKFKYKSGANWVSSTGNLNIGVKVRNTNGIFSRPLYGKKVGVIGDSISSFNKYNENLPGRYPTGDVSSVGDTWWMQLIQQTGAELTCNNSRGGAGITQVYEGDMQQRLHDLTDDTEVCFILMGTNDLGGRTFGKFDPTKKAYDPMVTTIPDGQSSEYFNLTEFCDAACNMIVMLQTYYPNIKFIWLTPLPRFDNTTGTVPYSMNGQTVQSYTTQIKEICKYYYWDYIDCSKIGINSINQTNYLADGLHPNLAGMTKLAEFVENNY